MERCDALIVGGGLVGSSLAIALDGAGLDVVLAEATVPAATSAPAGDRNLALARASVNALSALGVWPHAATDAAPIRRIEVSRRGRFGRVRLDAARLGLPEFGAVVPAHALGAALHARVASCRNLRRLAPARVTAIGVGAAASRVTLDVDGAPHAIDARLVVGADGTESFVRSAIGIPVTRVDHGQSAFVTTIATGKPLDGCAFERFTAEGPVALLPRADGRAGAVLTVASGDVAAVAALDDAGFCALLQERFGYRVGRLHGPGPRRPHPLHGVIASAVTGPRAVLVGNAAQTIHPIGAQGFNLGLRDALGLAELLVECAARNEDPGDAALLARHARSRASDRDATIAASRSLVRWMGEEAPLAGIAQSLGFVLLDRSASLKRKLALRGMGFGGDVPGLALSE